MDKDLTHTILMAALFLGLFALAELVYHIGKAKAEHTRKLVHAGTGLLTMLFPLLFTSVWPVFLLCALFALLLSLSMRFNLLQSINAIDRRSHGSISYPASVFFSFVFFTVFKCGSGNETNYASFYLPVLVLAFADPCASLCGRRWPFGKYAVGEETKTVTGSSAFFLVAAVVSFLILSFSDVCLPREAHIWCAVLIGLTGTATEAFSRWGLDNLFIPAAVILTYYLSYMLT